MKPRFLWISLIVVLGAALIYLVAFWDPLPSAAFTSTQGHDRMAAQTKPTGGDFTLQGPQGPVRLADNRGKVVVLYFGYTYCPDVCPTSLALIAQALSALDAAELQHVQAFFISLDPQRDTTTRLQEYAPFFHPELVGLSGTPKQIATVAAQYGASYQLQKANADGQYTVDHSSQTYVIDTQGKLALTLPHASPPARIAAAIRQQLAPIAAKRS